MVAALFEGSRRISAFGLPLLLALGCAARPAAQLNSASAGKQPAPASTPATQPILDSTNVRSSQLVEEEERLLKKQLEKTIPELRFENVSFVDAIAQLRDISQANIFVNWNALKTAGVNREAPVNLHLTNVKFSKALEVLLQTIPDAKLGYTFDEGVISISTAKDLLQLITRVYDVRELIVVPPDFDDAPRLGAQPIFPPDLGVSPASQPATLPAGRSTTRPAIPDKDAMLATVITLIKETIAPETWQGAAPVASIKSLSGQLIVTQTPENQAKIAQLLEQLREQNGIQVTVEARYLSGDDRAINDLLKKWKTTVPTTQPDAASMKSQGGTGVYLNDSQVNELLRATQNADDFTLQTAPRITLFNGQRAYVLVASSTAYTQDFTTIKDAKGELRYEPVIGTAESGIVFDAAAVVSSDRKHVTLSLRPQISALKGMIETPWPSRPAGSNLVIQTPRMETSEIRTVVSVPNNGTILLGGMSDPGVAISLKPATQPAAAMQSAKPGRKLYLLVKPTIIIQKVEEQRNFPLLNTRQ